jgi:hypothetical protein
LEIGSEIGYLEYNKYHEQNAKTFYVREHECATRFPFGLLESSGFSTRATHAAAEKKYGSQKSQKIAMIEDEKLKFSCAKIHNSVEKLVKKFQ